jgi:hypothetical protein
MKRYSRVSLILPAAALVAATTVAVSSTASAEGKSTLSSGEALALGDDGQTLRIFKLSDPEEDRLIGKVTGLLHGETKLEAIDYNVTDGKFYGFASGNDGGEFGVVYRLNTKTGAATQVASGEESFFAPDEHDVDFKPTGENHLFITSSEGSYCVTDIDVPGNQNPISCGPFPIPDPGIAFTNNDKSSATDSTLFAIDPADRAVKIVLVPDAPECCDLFPSATTGSLGLSSVSNIVGFDILSKTSDGRTTSNTGYASLRSSDTAEPNLYKIDLLTGKASKVDDFDKQIADIAVKQP